MLMIILNKPTALVVPAALGCRDYLSFSIVDSIVKRPSEYLGYKLIRSNGLFLSKAVCLETDNSVLELAS